MGRRIEINKVYALLEAYKSGRLGGEKMPYMYIHLCGCGVEVNSL